MLEILDPYIPLIVMIFTILLNVALLLTKSPWYGYLIGNIILVIVLELIGVKPFDLLGQMIDALFKILLSLLEKLGNAILKLLPSSCSNSTNSGSSASLPYVPPILPPVPPILPT